jgi:hypothetical protein
MDDSKMRELKALAQAATQSHGPRRVEVDHNGLHVIGDGSWKILSAWHTPDGKGAQNAEFAAATSPATVLALLAEIESLERKNANQSESIREYQDLVMGGDVSLGMLKAEIRSATAERDQLRVENEALHKDAERYRFVRNPIGTSSPLAIWNEGKMPLFSGMADAVVDEFMDNEVSHD